MRLIALGASNLTRGLLSLTDTARSAFGDDVAVYAALGHGRSYGQRSRFVVRDLPAILECGLWDAVAQRPTGPTRGLVTDVGNDILYGASAAQILEWVDVAVTRLRRLTDDVVVAGLPVDSIRTLHSATFLLVRSVLFPSCRLTLPQVRAIAQEVASGVEEIARRHGARFAPLRGEWYGFDPIHFRPRAWDQAWAEILGCPVREKTIPTDLAYGLSLYALPAERQWVLGHEIRRPQTGRRLSRGGTLHLY